MTNLAGEHAMGFFGGGVKEVLHRPFAMGKKKKIASVAAPPNRIGHHSKLSLRHSTSPPPLRTGRPRRRPPRHGEMRLCEREERGEEE